AITYRRKRIPLPAEPAQEAAGPDHPLPTHDPALVEALAQLDPAYRMPILLHYYSDLSLEQVGQSLNLSIPAIKSRLHRARAQLRNSLAEAEETAETRSTRPPSRARACASYSSPMSTATWHVMTRRSPPSGA